MVRTTREYLRITALTILRLLASSWSPLVIVLVVVVLVLAALLVALIITSILLVRVIGVCIVVATVSYQQMIHPPAMGAAYDSS